MGSDAMLHLQVSVQLERMGRRGEPGSQSGLTERRSQHRISNKAIFPRWPPGAKGRMLCKRSALSRSAEMSTSSEAVRVFGTPRQAGWSSVCRADSRCPHGYQDPSVRPNTMLRSQIVSCETQLANVFCALKFGFMGYRKTPFIIIIIFISYRYYH